MTAHRRQEQTLARNGGELQPGPSARFGERPATSTNSRPQPGMAGNCPQGPQPGFARNHAPPQPADPSQQWRGTAPRTLSQDWRGATHHHNQWTPARNGGEHRTRGPQPALARDHPPPQPVDPSAVWRETAPTVLSQDCRRTTHHHEQQTPARNGGELSPGPSARIVEALPKSTDGRPQPGTAGSCTQGPQAGIAGDHPKTPAANPGQERRGTAPRALSQD